MPSDISQLSDAELDKLIQEKQKASGTQGFQDTAPQGVIENAIEAGATGMQDLGNVLYSAVHPRETTKGIMEASKKEASQVIPNIKKGQYLDALNHAGRAIPLAGQMAGSIEDDINSGHYGSAVARLFELGLPKEAEALAPVARGVSRGFEAANDAKISPSARIAGHVGGFGLGEMLGHPYLGAYAGGQVLPRIGPFIKGALNIEERAPKALIGEVKPPPELSIGEMKSAVKSGAMSMDDFAARLGQKGYRPEDVKIQLETLQPKTVSKIEYPTQSKTSTLKSMSGNKMEQAVLNGAATIDDYRTFLTRNRIIPEDADALTDLLQKKLDAMKEIDYESSQNPEISKNLQAGATRKMPNGKIQVLQKTPLGSIDPDAGNQINPDKIAEYEKNGIQVHPELREGEESGRFTVQEGHHRLAASERLGNNEPLTWVPQELSQRQINRPIVNYTSKLQEHEVEALQSTDRAAKENRLAQFLVSSKHDLDARPTADMLKSLGKDAGINEPSLRTYENAVTKARILKKSLEEKGGETSASQPSNR